jgi:Sulfotransferase family
MLDRHSPNLVFIVGCPRSGTTWLRDIFKQHPQAVTSAESALFDCLREPWWISHRAPLPNGGQSTQGPLRKAVLNHLERLLLRRQPEWLPRWRRTLVLYFGSRLAFLGHHSGLLPVPTVWSRLRSQLVSYPRLLALIAEAESQSLPVADHEARVARVTAGIFTEFLARRGGGPDSVVVEKTPSHLFHAEFLLRHFPGARLIEVVRDGRDVCVSMDSYKKWMPQDREYQLWEWNHYVEEGLRLAGDPAWQGRILRVRYEDLHRDVEGWIERLFRFAGLATPPALVRQAADATQIRKIAKAGEGLHYRKGEVGDWRGRLSDADLALFRAKAGRSFEALGYEW